MPCYKPLNAWQSHHPRANGKSAILFVCPATPWKWKPIQLPCGGCVGCRLEYSRQWAVRCYHEASLHHDNCFITLTYNNDHLPSDKSLDLRHFQKFMKRLRKKYGPGIRFFHCGEYGEKSQRPHYHAILFNHDFQDRRFHKMSNGNPLYTSHELDALWSRNEQCMGHSLIGDVTFKSAAYVARYIMKKINGAMAAEYYQHIDPDTGEIHSLKPDYATMSRRPGIGKGWLEKYHSDVYPDDFIIIDGKKVRPPKYYDRLYEIDHTESFDQIKADREAKAAQHLDNNTPERLQVRETVQNARLSLLPRNLD